ncbi:hypothetical protein QE441_002718 [Chryseobacterium sp. SORGH_AS909]|uniref:Uncharacterized protein n=1 Tax=Chryseobacterium camelliae TaxID=1265445 RepID=A0ABU0TF00_9FLAO|nr:hypothetical protein [Chryseobacterium camelliae]MDQ1099577.1 hypothetical protein [Chryseobacterium sp. SORGH_AS_1048]MDR6086924.1 hypothetical protein [Chryseobacterium sp. SORGH_AS_0909]MDR6131297.1 hypothetical protein [Chryseobacterium sp. SORGH_AS_1175]MDT3406562.1 hypothetical protein [Pseudacidovorax intermedius]
MLLKTRGNTSEGRSVLIYDFIIKNDYLRILQGNGVLPYPTAPFQTGLMTPD